MTAGGFLHLQHQSVLDLGAHPAEQRTCRTDQASTEQQQRAGLRSLRDRTRKVQTFGAATGLLDIECQCVLTDDEVVIQQHTRSSYAIRLVLLAMAIATRSCWKLNLMAIQPDISGVVR